MRGPILVLSAMGACGFSPGASLDPRDAASVADAGSGSAGSGSGSGSGSAQPMCPSGDDDQDGVCNGADDWPCGAKPNAPGDFEVTNIFGYDFKDHQVSIDGQGKLAVVEPGTQFSLDFDFDLNMPCQTGTSCHMVIETGTQAGKQGCGAEKTATGQQILVFQLALTGGHSQNNLQIGTPGQYRILGIGSRADACGTNWVQNAPSDDFTLGFVCVHHQP